MSDQPAQPKPADLPDAQRTGVIFDIQKFSLHDGPGIRTTVFLKGCPLRCLWCHNPESQDARPEISLIPEKCIACGTCFELCPVGCHAADAGERRFRRDRCTRCGCCTENCPTGALELIGRRASVAEVLAEVLRDRCFYESSDGGMTLSGGEPMAQFEFSRALLAEARAAGIHTCLETSGFGPAEHYERIAPLVDLFLFDCKQTGADRHKAQTGVSNETILANLARLDELNCAVILRCPIVPGLNADREHFEGIAELAERTGCVKDVHLLGYHPLGDSKSVRLDREDAGQTYPSVTDEQKLQWAAYIAERTRATVQWM